MPTKLFAVYLGGRAPRCNTELHDVIFVAGSSIEDCYFRIIDKWFGDPMKIHIDSWMELSVVDGYRISLQSKPSPSDKKLFFINLGAYTPGQFTELHANAFLVAADEAEVKIRAKSALLRGMQSVHTDDLYDVDDCLEISEVDGRHVHLEPTTEAERLEPQNGYYVIPAEVLQGYADRSYKVQFGKVLRTVKYQDSVGEILFTTDSSSKGQKWITLEHHPTDPKRPSRYPIAFERARQWLEGCGFRVEIYGKTE